MGEIMADCRFRMFSKYVYSNTTCLVAISKSMYRIMDGRKSVLHKVSPNVPCHLLVFCKLCGAFTPQIVYRRGHKIDL